MLSIDLGLMALLVICGFMFGGLCGSATAGRKLPHPNAGVKEAVIASRGDVLVLRATGRLSCDQYHAASTIIGGAAKSAGIKIILLDQSIEVAQLIKLHGDGGDGDKGAN